MPDFITYATIESASNVVMFVPIGAVIALIVMPPRWWLSGVWGLAASTGIELVQLAFLPQRFASVGDVVANTSGALIGGIIIVVLRRFVSSRRED